MSLCTEQKRVSPTFMVEMLVTALADPHNPQCCAKSIVACVYHLHHWSFKLHNIRVLRSNFPQVYETFVRFITAPRSTGEHSRLQEEMSVCKCDLADSQMQALHALDTGHVPCTYTRAGMFMETVVSDSLDIALRNGRLHKVQKKQQRAERKGKHVFWPRSPDDIFPYGLDASISGLASWINYAPGDLCHFEFLTGILEAFKKDAISPILASPTLPGDLVRVAQKPFLIALDQYPEDPPLPPGSQYVFDLDDVAAGVRSAARFYERLLDYFDEDELRALSSLAAAQTRAAGQEPAVDFVSICSLALNVLPSLLDTCAALNTPTRTRGLQRSLATFRRVGGVLHRLLGLPLDSTRYPEPILRSVRAHHALRDAQGVYVAVYDALLTLARHARCWAPACRATCTAAQRPFAVCKGCKRVTYCSRECQARAWQHPDVPHQAICKTLRYIVDATDLPVRPEPANSAAVEQVFVASGVEWDALVRFRDHMGVLQKHTTFAPSLEPAPDEATSHCSQGEDLPSSQTPTASGAALRERLSIWRGSPPRR